MEIRISKTALRTVGLLAFVAAVSLPLAAQGQEEELSPGITAYNAGKYVEAATAFYPVVESGTDKLDRQKAEYFLAQSFYKLHLYQPAFQFYGTIVKQGGAHRYYFKAIEGLVDVAEALDDSTVIPSLLNRSYGPEFEKLPEETLNKVNYLVGMLSYRANKPEEAQEFLSAVGEKTSYYARARYLSGIALMSKSAETSIKIFLGIMDLKPSGHYYDLENVQQLTRLALARTYYGLGKYGEAVKWFSSVPRFSEYWDQALFENGWALFQDEQPGPALGSLESLHAPQFEGAFSPESWVLKSTIYFYSCLYPESKGAIAGFRRVYLPMNEKIKAALVGDHDFDFYAELIQHPKGEIPLAAVNYLLANKRVKGFKSYLDELEIEKKRVETIPSWKGNNLGSELSQVIDAQIQTLEKLTGKFVQIRLQYATKVIEGFDSQAEILLFETLKSEKELIEKNVDVTARLAAQKLYRAPVPDPTWAYWSFDGEFWIDEIGYYQYTLKNACALRQESVQGGRSSK